MASLDKWEDYTEAKEAMFFYTDSATAHVLGKSEHIFGKSLHPGDKRSIKDK